ncbi:NAD-dependent epimerase/dehydratase family protein [Nocardioides nanhaiensis]|uniref:NAD-dependent epimerase/dehydratase n=1 Tax=Nocardioides nanhaiensis TaxID=1476871 RepID=A0ABP8VQJ4_9ACTN
MSDSAAATDPQPVLVVGANGLVGAQVCTRLASHGTPVRALVRRAGTAPQAPGVTEVVGEMLEPADVEAALAGCQAVVTTVHPMGSDRATQAQVGVQGNLAVARAAAAVGVDRLVHVSTAAVYDRSPGVGDVDEDSAVVPDDADDYAVTKRDTDAAIAEVEGITRVLVRPPAILGEGETSVWNTLRPRGMQEDPSSGSHRPEQSWPWVHVADLAALIADVATGAIPTGTDPSLGPVPGGCTVVNAAGRPATQADYHRAVAGALDLELPEVTDGEVWRGRLVADRALAWGWTPQVDLDVALTELAEGLR